ncbi:MAG: type II toxin-antitoxin system RelE/ParE family toxin [Verrucomicrobiaceae bacterium]|nr:MAG: type II toxin-antitoxin system RelE/ParE family toxin [Verrucomicrobiaceae bacterium]
MASYKVEVNKSASRDIRGIDRKWVPKILLAVEALGTDPRPVGCLKLVGSEYTYRIRVGDYRVIYELHDHMLIILVVRIRHRGDAYR